MSGNNPSDAAAVLLLGICLILCAAWLSGAAPGPWTVPPWACPAVAAVIYLAIALGVERFSLRALGLWALLAAGHVLYAALMALSVQALRPGPAELPAALDFALRNPPAALLQLAFVIPGVVGLAWPALAGRRPSSDPSPEILQAATTPRQFLTAVLALDSRRRADPRMALRRLAVRARELLAQEESGDEQPPQLVACDVAMPQTAPGGTDSGQTG